MSEQLAIPLEQAPSGGLTELVLTQNTAHSQALVLPMVAHLSQQDNGRWLTWLIDDAIEPEQLKRFGVDTRRVRFVHCRERTEQLWVLWDALALGNSHTVVASPGLLDREAMAQLELAAQRGGCQGVLLRQR